MPLLSEPLALAARAGPNVLLAALLFPARWRELLRFVAVGERLAEAARPFERTLAQARLRLLVIGDSTGVGTGARCPEDSIAGRIACDFPAVAIVNRARNGAKTGDALAQLAPFAGTRFDVVLIHVGGNDVLRRTPMQQLAHDADALVAGACAIGARVLVTTTPNVGLAPAFAPPVSWWLTLRSRRVRDTFAAACRRHGAHYANFFHPRAHDPFSQEWTRYYAEDRLHPSSACYGYVYAALLRATPLAHWLTQAGRSACARR